MMFKIQGLGGNVDIFWLGDARQLGERFAKGNEGVEHTVYQ